MGQEGKNVRELSDNDRKNLNDIFNPYTDDKESTDEFKKAAWRGYTIEKEVPEGSLLFISMNPSYPYPENIDNDPWKNAVYSITNFGKEEKVKKKRKNEKEENNGYKRVTVKEINSFFKQIHKFYIELKKELNENSNILPPLAHHDLLFIRETSQKNVLKWKENKIRKRGEDDKFKWVEREGEEKVGNFFTEQLDLSKKIIVESNPRLIVVLNAGARKLFQEEELLFKKDKCKGTFDEEITATYMYDINGKDVPVIFTGMLSGQHALDSGSKNILKDYIKLVLKKINTKESEV